MVIDSCDGLQRWSRLGLTFTRHHTHMSIDTTCASETLSHDLFDRARVLQIISVKRAAPFKDGQNARSLCINEKGNTLKRPQSTPSLAHGVDKECSHEKPDCEAYGNLDHRSRDIEDNGIEAVGCCLDAISIEYFTKRESKRTSTDPSEPLINADAVLSAEAMLPLEARLPGTWTYTAGKRTAAATP